MSKLHLTSLSPGIILLGFVVEVNEVMKLHIFCSLLNYLSKNFLFMRQVDSINHAFRLHVVLF